ncbi:MAG: GIY-YIG nuclease family protein [Holophagales bacterium]|jgi:hypothetical protein|nr:GIY-YIG nuclease family protein [Holophagales bacterium]
MKPGFVYIAKNPAFPHVFKIGITTKEIVEDRGLTSSNVPEDFEFLLAKKFDNIEMVEDVMQRLFDSHRHTSMGGRYTEFFYQGCLEDAISTLDDLAKKYGAKDVREQVEEILIEEEESKTAYKKSDTPVSDFVSWGDLRLKRDPDDKFITEPDAQSEWNKAMNGIKMRIIKKASEEGAYKDKKISLAWLKNTVDEKRNQSYFDTIMNLKWDKNRGGFNK